MHFSINCSFLHCKLESSRDLTFTVTHRDAPRYSMAVALLQPTLVPLWVAIYLSEFLRQWDHWSQRFNLFKAVYISVKGLKSTETKHTAQTGVGRRGWRTEKRWIKMVLKIILAHWVPLKVRSRAPCQYVSLRKGGEVSQRTCARAK